MNITLYGLNKCRTCVKARDWLDSQNIAYVFIDYRDHPVAAATLTDWAGQLGGWEKLVNRASMTWRNLPESRKAPADTAEWTALITEYPALVRRPVALDAAGKIGVGFNDKRYRERFA